MQEANEILLCYFLLHCLVTLTEKNYQALREMSKHNFNQEKVSLV